MTTRIPPVPVPYQLTEPQLIEAAATGLSRRLQGIRAAVKPRFGAQLSVVGLWDQDIEASAAEKVVSLFVELEWTSRYDATRADVGDWIQVRHTDADRRLLVRPKDSNGDAFVLVSGSYGQYLLHGWCLGGFAKQQAWASTPRKRPECYLVPQAELEPMATLLARIALEQSA